MASSCVIMSASVRPSLSQPEFLSRSFDRNRPSTARASRDLSPVKEDQRMEEPPPSRPDFPGSLWFGPVVQEVMKRARERARGLDPDHPPPRLDINNNAATPHYEYQQEAYIDLYRDDEPQYAVALRDFTPLRGDEMALWAGDLITVTDPSGRNWWRGYTLLQEGRFPASHVQALESYSAPLQHASPAPSPPPLHPRKPHPHLTWDYLTPARSLPLSPIARLVSPHRPPLSHASALRRNRHPGTRCLSASNMTSRDFTLWGLSHLTTSHMTSSVSPRCPRMSSHLVPTHPPPAPLRRPCLGHIQ